MTVLGMTHVLGCFFWDEIFPIATLPFLARLRFRLGRRFMRSKWRSMICLTWARKWKRRMRSLGQWRMFSTKKRICVMKNPVVVWAPNFLYVNLGKWDLNKWKRELGDATGMGIYRSSLDSRKNRTFGTQIITKLLGFVTQKNATSCIQ